MWLSRRGSVAITAAVCTTLMVSGPGNIYAQETAAPPKPADAAPAKLPADQLDALVAAIALYPDSLLAQTLVASTYPLEIVQLHQWMQKNSTLKDKALADAVAKE